MYPLFLKSMGLTLSLILALSSAAVRAEQPSPSLQKARMDLKKPRVPASKPLKKDLKPDLVVSSILLTKDCRILVTVRNNGPGPVPEKAYDQTKGAVVQASAMGTPWGGYRLFMVDRQKNLQKTGGTATITGFKRPLKPGENLTVKATVLDPENVMDEVTEKNNARIKGLICPGEPKSLRSMEPGQLKPGGDMRPLRLRPDLTITLMKIEPANPTTKDNIRFSAFITNTGHATAAPSTAEIKIDKEADPLQLNKPAISPQSSEAVVRLEKVETPGTHRIFFQVDVNDEVRESKEDNNTGYLDFTVAQASPHAQYTGDGLSPPGTAVDPALVRDLPFQIIHEEMHVYNDPNNTSFSIELEASQEFDPSTVTLSDIQATIRLFDQNGLLTQNSLSGQIDSISGNTLVWQSPQLQQVEYCYQYSSYYCEMVFYFGDNVHSLAGRQLDGDKDGQPGGQYRETFYLDSVSLAGE